MMLRIDFTPQEAQNFERWFRENAKDGVSFDAVRMQALRVFAGRLYAGERLAYGLPPRYACRERSAEYVASMPDLGITEETVMQELIEQAGEFDDEELLEGVSLGFGGYRVDTQGWLQAAVAAGEALNAALETGIRCHLQRLR